MKKRPTEVGLSRIVDSCVSHMALATRLKPTVKLS